MIGFVVIVVALVGIVLPGPAAVGQPAALVLLALLAVPTALVEINGAYDYLLDGFPP